MTVLSGQDNRDFLKLAVAHSCQDPMDLLVTEGGCWCCGASHCIARPWASEDLRTAAL